MPVPPILTHLTSDPDRLEEWSPDCGGGWLAIAYETAILHAGMRCGKCWECVVYRFDERAEREAGIFDLTAERFGAVYEMSVPLPRWNAERKWLRERGFGWRGWTHPDIPVVGGYTDAPEGQIVRQSNWVPFSHSTTTLLLLQENGTSLESRTIFLPRCRSGGTFKRPDLRIHNGGERIHPAPSRKRVLEVAETLHGRVEEGISAWETEQVVVTFPDESTTSEAVRLLKARAA